MVFVHLDIRVDINNIKFMIYVSFSDTFHKKKRRKTVSSRIEMYRECLHIGEVYRQVMIVYE